MRLVRPLAWLLLALVVLHQQVRPHLEAGRTSFPGYWVVAREVLAGTPSVQLYDDAWLARKMQEHGFSADRMLGPPALALTALPVAWLPYSTARKVWMLGLLFPALMGSLWWLTRRLHPAWGLTLAAAIALSRPVEAGMEVAQIYPLMLALHCLGLWAWRADRPREGGLALAPMLLVRGWHGLPQALGWAVSGRPVGILWALGAAAVGAALTVPVLGLDGWTHFAFVQSREVGSSETAMVLAYQTWRSLALHLTTTHPVFGPDPPLPGLGPSIWLAGAAIVLGTSLWAGRGAHSGGGGFALWTTVALLLAPFAEDHHMLLAAVPAAILWAEAPRLRPLVVAALALLLPSWKFDQPSLIGGWRCLLAYPRVCGVGLLWMGSVALTARAPRR